jgi:NTP pyrophosphatase (non-canonical NTP hydrolase)
MTPEQSMTLTDEQHAAVRDEVADTLIYLVELSDVLGIDLITAARDKMAKNAVKYPVKREE